MSKRNQNFPGDSDCDGGLVSDCDPDDPRTHICLNCAGAGCPPPKTNRGAAARHRDLVLSLSGSTVIRDQKGRTVFVDLAKGIAHVVD